MPEWEGDDAYVLTLDKSNMVVITNFEELMTFHEEFSVPHHGMEMIDWAKVASKYDGIEIAPYIHKGRWELMWYSTWDVASGCIWSTNVIKNSQKL